MTSVDELTRLLARYEEGLYTAKEVIAVATRTLRCAEDFEAGWRVLPEWVQVDARDLLDAAAEGDIVMFHESNIDKALEEMVSLRRRLMEAGLLNKR